MSTNWNCEKREQIEESILALERLARGRGRGPRTVMVFHGQKMGIVKRMVSRVLQWWGLSVNKILTRVEGA